MFSTLFISRKLDETGLQIAFGDHNETRSLRQVDCLNAPIIDYIINIYMFVAFLLLLFNISYNVIITIRVFVFSLVYNVILN